MAGVYSVLFEQSFSSTDTIDVTHNLNLYYASARVIIEGNERNDLIQNINADSTSPRDKLIVKLLSAQTGVIQILSSDVPSSTSASPEESVALRGVLMAGGADMMSGTYDPTGVSGDIFDSSNHSFSPDVLGDWISGSIPTKTDVALDQLASRIQESGSMDSFDAYDNAGGISVTGSWTPITLDTERIKDSIFTHSPGAADVTIDVTDKYLVLGRVTTDVSAGTNRSQAAMKFTRDTGSGFVDVPGTLAEMYARQASEGEATGVSFFIETLNAGDKIRIESFRTSGTSTIVTEPSGSSMSIIRLKGTKGDKGDTGSGSSISLKVNGSPVNGTPHTTLNFSGSNISITNDGSGSANIIINTETVIKEETVLAANMLAGSPPAGLFLVNGFPCRDFGGLIAPDSAVAHTVIEIPPDAQPGQPGIIKTHWFHEDTEDVGNNLIFQVEYMVTSAGGDTGASKTLLSSSAIPHGTTDVMYKSVIGTIPSISPGDFVDVKMFRDTQHVNDSLSDSAYANVVHLEIEYTSDRRGE